MRKKLVLMICSLFIFLSIGVESEVIIPYDLSKIPVYPYKSVDGNPVGNTDPTAYIKSMRLPKEVEAYFIERAKGDPGEESAKAYLSKKDNKNVPSDGKHFASLYAMGYGKDGALLWNVIVKYGIVRPAIFWKKDYKGARYYLIRDNKCHNWAFYCELAPAPAIVSMEKKKIETETVLPVGDGANLLPQEKEKETAEHWYSNLDLDPDWDSWIGAGLEFGLNNDDFGYYYTGFISFFPRIVYIGDAKVFLGPSYQHTGWAGSTGDVTYDGYFDFFGADLRYKMDQDEYQLKVYYGKKHGTVEGDGIPYYAESKANIFALEGTYLWWNDTEQDEIGFRFEFDLGGSKYSSWAGNEIPSANDSRDDETMIYARYKHTWVKQDSDIIPATKTAQASIAHVSADSSVRAGVDIGLKVYDDNIEPTVGLRYNFKNDKLNGVAGIQIHASDIAKDIWKMITSDGSDEQSTD